VSNAWLAVLSLVGLIGWVLVGFVTSAVIAATTKTGWIAGMNGGPGYSVPSGGFAVFCGVVWPITLVIAAVYHGALLAGRALRPGKQWNRLVHRLNPGVKVHW